MASFIFQAIPERYDLGERLKEGSRVNWVASRYRDEMRPGSIVYFWQAGDAPQRGVYGWGTIEREPHSRAGSEYRVEVVYRCNFQRHDPPTHVSSQELSEDPRLSGQLLFRMPIGTNFLLTSEEDQAVRDAIERAVGADYVPPDQVAGGGADD